VGHGREGSVVACWLRGAWGMAGNVLPDVVEKAWSCEPLKMRFHGSNARWSAFGGPRQWSAVSCDSSWRQVAGGGMIDWGR
jgi:hypothetical protein